jgi:deoxyribodipyrimidine photo-lyase
VHAGGPVACAFVLDRGVLQGEDAAPARVAFLLEGLRDLDERLRERGGGGLILREGDGADEIARLAHELGAVAVHACADGEPYALARDARAATACQAAGAPLELHHDQTLVEHERIRSAEGHPYRTYSAYARGVERVLADEPIATRRLELKGHLRAADGPAELPSLEQLGVRGSARGPWHGGETRGLAALRAWRDDGLDRYAARRDDVGRPEATSHLSPYLKLGMLSPRRCAAVARTAGARKWSAELLWRDWFKYVLHQHPDLATMSVDPRFERVPWPGSDDDFEAWCRGETGYGLVDAGMRQLAQAGYQPNRVRMVCASFLCKHLHVDWRRGEQWYRRHLIDGDLSSNAGGWQWVAGTGLDAAPYFRVLNPLLQEKKFDTKGAYVARWAPDRPAPMVDLAQERERALELYRAARDDTDERDTGR